METKIPAIAATDTKVLEIENAADGESAPGCPGVAPPGPDAGPFGPVGAGGDEVFGLGDEGEGAGEVVEGEGVGDFVEGDGAGDSDPVGAGAGACARHDVAKSPNITNNLIATKPMLYMFSEIEEC
ncbi:hypothetical protein L195_g046414 [Trifolium pratense]|uniref:Uncharacterized protein n=2 Tax=Trifolium pratense TaxID=57577 RepID=A0ACB0IWJ5_TRIPR|nr:uncharacterized protein LOC123924490 [Trifolium pratense]PNX90291.1 hypothetical protein L195_g046414 [Trifolium pratense]CAJ2636256.1 unnamed protein product [Trifolium pratense]